MGISPAKHVYLRCSARYRQAGSALGQLPVADWAGCGHCTCPNLASLLTRTMPFVSQNVPDARVTNPVCDVTNKNNMRYSAGLGAVKEVY